MTDKEKLKCELKRLSLNEIKDYNKYILSKDDYKMLN